MKHIIIFTLLLFTSCGGNKAASIDSNKNVEKVTEVETKLPSDIALSFINSYVENCNKMKESIAVVEWVNANKLVTNGLKSELKRIYDEAYGLDPEMGLDSDPLFDAQDYPENGFELASFDSKSNYLIVKGKDGQDFKVRMKMVFDGNQWLVDGCGIINIPVNKRMAR